MAGMNLHVKTPEIFLLCVQQDFIQDKFHEISFLVCIGLYAYLIIFFILKAKTGWQNNQTSTLFI